MDGTAQNVRSGDDSYRKAPRFATDFDTYDPDATKSHEESAAPCVPSSVLYSIDQSPVNAENAFIPRITTEQAVS